MKPIYKLFVLHRAKSGLFTDYDPGDVAYIGNSLDDNGVLGFVKPLAKDKVFDCNAIVVSAFCDATVQTPPFIACGRAGNGLTVLQPKSKMTLGQLAFIAAYINQAVSWRFNWYRQITVDRLKDIPVLDQVTSDLAFPVVQAIPVDEPISRPKWRMRSSSFTLDDIFEMVPGDYHALNELPKGRIPVVSCGEGENGIAGFFDVPGPYSRNKLTIALNGSPLLTKYHPYDFAAKDDVAVCAPRETLGLATLLFVQVALNRERWRYSYYRKCYIDKLRRFQIQLPSYRGKVDEATIETIVKAAPYWKYLERHLANEEVVKIRLQ